MNPGTILLVRRLGSHNLFKLCQLASGTRRQIPLRVLQPADGCLVKASDKCHQQREVVHGVQVAGNINQFRHSLDACTDALDLQNRFGNPKCNVVEPSCDCQYTRCTLVRIGLSPRLIQKLVWHNLTEQVKFNNCKLSCHFFWIASEQVDEISTNAHLDQLGIKLDGWRRLGMSRHGQLLHPGAITQAKNIFAYLTRQCWLIFDNDILGKLLNFSQQYMLGHRRGARLVVVCRHCIHKVVLILFGPLLNDIAHAQLNF